MELEFVRWLQSRLPAHPQLRLGIGDDAAVLRLGERSDCVVTVDMLSDGVDFVLVETNPRRIGHKALAVNLSDLAAMAARPLAAVVAVTLPQQGGRELAEALYEGLLPLAARYNVAIAGGDTNSWDGPLVISVTAIGELPSSAAPSLQPPAFLTRSGAKPGDQLLVTGTLGGSILGKHLDFEPRVNEALLLNERYTLHAGMDISDGLTLDLSRLCAASGCGAVLDLAAIPISDAARELSNHRGNRSPLDHALGDGEDFELLLAVPPAEAERLLRDRPLAIPLTRIGEVVAEPGLWQAGDSGPRSLAVQGYEHRLE